MHSINQKEEILFLIQFSNPLLQNNLQKIKKKKGLGMREELLVNLFIKISSILIESMMNEDVIEKLKNKHKIFIDASHYLPIISFNEKYYNSDYYSSKQ